MKKTIYLILASTIFLSGCATWTGVKEDSSNAWEATKEGTSKAYKNTKEAIHEATRD